MTEDKGKLEQALGLLDEVFDDAPVTKQYHLAAIKSKLVKMQAPGPKVPRNVRWLRIIKDLLYSPDTYYAIAKRHGMTRERVGQIASAMNEVGFTLTPRPNTATGKQPTRGFEKEHESYEESELRLGDEEEEKLRMGTLYDE